MAFEAGQRVGDYEVVRVLGAGGLGEVYEVRHAISQRAEAMKVLLPDQQATVETGERFRREIQMLGALSHPNIASLHNAFYYESQLIMIMELVTGETLRSKSIRTLLSVPQVLRYAREILSALEYAHHRNVVHRDIKPSNIMITAEDDEVKLLDFGIAITDRSSELTAPGFLVGSISYMSPEQISGDKATVRSDLYAVGVTLYEVLTGRLPVSGTSNFSIMRSHLTEQPVPPLELNPRLPAALSNAVLRALEKKPEDRFGSAQEFLTALNGVAGSGIEDIYSLPTTMVPVQGGSTPRPQQSDAHPAKSVSVSTPQTLPLGDITKKLAVYIGPIASVLVRKLAANCTDIDQLYKEAATHIASETDRRRFLQSRHG
jgi:serine/threonine-protein kinase